MAASHSSKGCFRVKIRVSEIPYISQCLSEGEYLYAEVHEFINLFNKYVLRPCCVRISL